MTHEELIRLFFGIIRITGIVSVVLIWLIYSVKSLDFWFMKVYNSTQSNPSLEISPYIRATLLFLFFLLTAAFSFTVGWAIHFYEKNK